MFVRVVHCGLSFGRLTRRDGEETTLMRSEGDTEKGTISVHLHDWGALGLRVRNRTCLRIGPLQTQTRENRAHCKGAPEARFQTESSMHPTMVFFAPYAG